MQNAQKPRRARGLKFVPSLYLGLDGTNPVFGVSDKARLKPVSPATETSLKIEISLVASLDMLLSKKLITKVFVVCSFSRVEAHL